MPFPAAERGEPPPAPPAQSGLLQQLGAVTGPRGGEQINCPGHPVRSADPPAADKRPHPRGPGDGGVASTQSAPSPGRPAPEYIRRLSSSRHRRRRHAGHLTARNIEVQPVDDDPGPVPFAQTSDGHCIELSHAFSLLARDDAHIGPQVELPLYPRVENRRLRGGGGLAGFGPMTRLAVEGTGSHGAGLARFLRAAGVHVAPGDRPAARPAVGPLAPDEPRDDPLGSAAARVQAQRQNWTPAVSATVANGAEHQGRATG